MMNPATVAKPFAVQREVVLLDTGAGPPLSEVAVRPDRGRDRPPICLSAESISEGLGARHARCVIRRKMLD